MPKYEPGEFVFDYLKDGSSVEMNVNGSVTAVDFDYTVPAGLYLELYKMTMMMTDGEIRWGDFAGLGTALTNGIEIQVLDSDENLLLDVTNSEDIKANEDLGFLAGTDAIRAGSAGDTAYIADMVVAVGQHPMVLAPGSIVRAKVQDDLTGVSYLRTSIHGRLATTTE